MCSAAANKIKGNLRAHQIVCSTTYVESGKCL